MDMEVLYAKYFVMGAGLRASHGDDDEMDIWRSSEDFSVASVRKIIDDKSLSDVDSKTRWIKYVPIKVNVHAWKVKTDSLPTRQIVRKITRWWDVPYVEVESYEDWYNWLVNLRISSMHKQMFEGIDDLEERLRSLILALQCLLCSQASIRWIACHLSQPIIDVRIAKVAFPLTSGMTYWLLEETDLENGRFDKDKERSLKTSSRLKVNNQALLSGLAYCLSSCSMILVNKYVLSSYDFNAGISLMLYQNFVSVLIVSSLSILGVISTEPLTWRLIKVWLPVNFIFVGMLVRVLLFVGDVIYKQCLVLKNFTNVITAVGEMYLFNKHHDNRMWASLFSMIIFSNLCRDKDNLSFNAVGYTWQFINCFLTASYSVSNPVRRFTADTKIRVCGFAVNTAAGSWIQQNRGLVAGVFFARAKIKERTQS
ncbi:hypothetical protein Tco_1111056 [Tanacetum coccineum]|uniref:Sugar phosphate transporter domain-containing protein n=1 Tax=Tanacetum coccineum TaxID=301880 RepID=A0ABQ5IN09_9ASTR